MLDVFCGHSEVLIIAPSGRVGTGTNYSGYPTNQDLARLASICRGPPSQIHWVTLLLARFRRVVSLQILNDQRGGRIGDGSAERLAHLGDFGFPSSRG
jgi:hypothetical protein